MTWPRFLSLLLGTFVGALAIVLLLIAVANPFGNLPGWVMREHAIMDTNQRFQYPAIVRSNQFDSIVVGTSTSRLFDPGDLERLFGGRFANLAMDSGTAWEQHRLALLFTETIAVPRTLLVGLDHVWCYADADQKRITPRGFPEWLFDSNPWNDLPNMFNARAAEIAGRRIGHAVGLQPVRIPFDGYEIFLPPDSAYDRERAVKAIFGRSKAKPAPEQGPRYVPSEAEQKDWRFPALDWLRRITDPDQRWQRIVLVFTPVHVSALPQPGSREEAREAECKSRIAVLARERGIPLVDFRIGSAITEVVENYWDPLHYRVPIAGRIMAGIGKAVAGGSEEPAGDWRLLSRAGAAEVR